jgi:hypothetical protein
MISILNIVIYPKRNVLEFIVFIYLNNRFYLYPVQEAKIQRTVEVNQVVNCFSLDPQLAELTAGK